MNEFADMEILSISEEMDKVIQGLENEFSAVRTGRPNINILNKVTVNYYGTQTSLRQIANVNVADGTTLVIKPYEKSMLKEIESGINKANIGLPMTNDGVIIRMIFPVLTTERRKELIKTCEKVCENFKITIRNLRRDANDKIVKFGLSEDDERGYLADVQELTNKFITKTEVLLEKKKEEILK
jgi:ribosome recycling factor